VYVAVAGGRLDLDQRDFPTRADFSAKLGQHAALAFAAGHKVGRRSGFFERSSEMSIFGWIILGLIAGFIGSKIVNSQGQGFWLNIALGIIGALVGGFLFSLFGSEGVTGLNIWSMIVAIVGSIVVLLIYNALVGHRSA
jgi:uncharacterized membrane protein YeaQ/YmgE (transglycosylase-associated protein family)